MSIRDNRLGKHGSEHDDLIRKANQEWDQAGLARQDGDMKASVKHTEKAKEYERQALELR